MGDGLAARSMLGISNDEATTDRVEELDLGERDGQEGGQHQREREFRHGAQHREMMGGQGSKEGRKIWRPPARGKKGRAAARRSALGARSGPRDYVKDVVEPAMVDGLAHH